jgi:uncharacterized protein YodC (DUF2158 family)
MKAKFKLGDKVSPVIGPAITMMIDAVIQTSSNDSPNYHCRWFDGHVMCAADFADFEIEPAKENGKMGYR